VKFQSFGCQDNKDVLSEEAVTYLNSLCAWVYFQDDSSDEEDSDDSDDSDEETAAAGDEGSEQEN